MRELLSKREGKNKVSKLIKLKGMNLDHDVYVVVCKQRHTDNDFFCNTISLYKLTMFFYYSFVLGYL